MHRFRTSRLPIVAAALVLAACSDATTLARPGDEIRPDPESPVLAALTCTASLETRAVRCTDAAGQESGPSRVILGGQNQYVTLASSGIAVTADTFGVDVTVTNLIPQPLGVNAGGTNDPAGVRVFFANGPTSTGTGTVSVANPDGTATFTAGSQPYYQYAGGLEMDATSEAKRWKFQFTPDVTNFTFRVFVAAEVMYPDGYIESTPYVLSLNPNETRALVGTPVNVVGNPLPGETVTWTSNAPGTAAVSGTQVTAGAARGVAELTATNGPREGLYATTVSVCQATVVADGTSLPSSISSSDCFSSYGSNDGRPTTSYYADLYRVSLTAGQTVTVTMDSGDDLDTYLLLADPQLGFLVAGNDDDDDGELGVGSKMIYTAEETGVYVIEASTFNGLDTGNYTLGIEIN